MDAVESGLRLTKAELRALLGCGPSAVLFTVSGDTVRAYATNTSMSVEAIGNAGSGALQGAWLVDPQFLKECLPGTKQKTTIVLKVSNGDDEDSPVPSLFSAAFMEDFESEDELRTLETGRYSWTESAANPVQQIEPDEPNPLAYSTIHDRAVPCISLYAEHLAVVVLVAKAAGRGVVDQIIQDSKHKAVGFEVNGATRWRVTTLPAVSEVEEGRDSDAGFTISSGETSVTLSAGELRRAVEALS